MRAPPTVGFVANDGQRGRALPGMRPSAGGFAMMTGEEQPRRAPPGLPSPARNGGGAAGVAGEERRGRAPLDVPTATRGGGGVRQPLRSGKRSGGARPYRGCRGGRRGKHRRCRRHVAGGRAHAACREPSEARRGAGRKGEVASFRPDLLRPGSVFAPAGRRGATGLGETTWPWAERTPPWTAVPWAGRPQPWAPGPWAETTPPWPTGARAAGVGYGHHVGVCHHHLEGQAQSAPLVAQ